LVTTILILIPYCTLVIGYIILFKAFSPLDWFLGIGSALILLPILFTINFNLWKRAEKRLAQVPLKGKDGASF
jgi:hypothetical protein